MDTATGSPISAAAELGLLRTALRDAARAGDPVAYAALVSRLEGVIAAAEGVLGLAAAWAAYPPAAEYAEQVHRIIADTMGAARGTGKENAVTETEEHPICGVRWPNLGPAAGLWTCTLDAGHDGDHEARGPGGSRLGSPSSVIPQGHEAVLERDDACGTEDLTTGDREAVLDFGEGSGDAEKR